MFYVYLHRRATDGAIFYVGKGRGQRAWNHWRRNPHWKAVANKHGLIVEIVERFMEEAGAFDCERRMIAECRARGIVLTNKTDGGEGPAGMRHTAETKAKNAAARLGRKRGPQSEAHRLKISASQMGKIIPADTRALIASAVAVAMKRPEIIAKMRAAKLGKKRAPHTLATRAKMRAAALGKPKSAAARLSMSVAQRKRFQQERIWTSAV